MNTTARHAGLKVLAIACLCVSFILILSAYAGVTTITTSDNAPTYGPTSNEVVVGPDQSVTLKTTWTNGGVSPLAYTWTPSGGLTLLPGYPVTTSNSEVAMFSITSAGAGTVNNINLHILRTGSAANCSTSQGNIPNFVVCVPIVTAPISDAENLYYEQFFQTKPTIAGCDDFSQIQFQQQINAISTTTLLTGMVTTAGSGPWLNTNNAYTADVVDMAGDPWTWDTVTDPAGVFTTSGSVAETVYYDVHNNPWNHHTVVISGNTYNWGQLADEMQLIKEQIRRTADQKELTASEYSWGYIWTNSNVQWTTSTTPSLTQFTSAMNTSPQSTTATFGGSVPPTSSYPGTYTTEDPATLGL